MKFILLIALIGLVSCDHFRGHKTNRKDDHRRHVPHKILYVNETAHGLEPINHIPKPAGPLSLIKHRVHDDHWKEDEEARERHIHERRERREREEHRRHVPHKILYVNETAQGLEPIDHIPRPAGPLSLIRHRVHNDHWENDEDHKVVSVNDPHPDLKPIDHIPKPAGPISIIKDQGHNDHFNNTLEAISDSHAHHHKREHHHRDRDHKKEHHRAHHKNVDVDEVITLEPIAPLPESSIPLSEIIEQGFDNVYDGVRTDARGHRIIDVNNPHPDLKPIVTIPRPVGPITIIKDQGHNDHFNNTLEAISDSHAHHHKREHHRRDRDHKKEHHRAHHKNVDVDEIITLEPIVTLPESSIPLSEIIEQGFDNIYDEVRTDARGHRIIDVNDPHPDLKPIVTIPRPVGPISIIKDQGHNDHFNNTLEAISANDSHTHHHRREHHHRERDHKKEHHRAHHKNVDVDEVITLEPIVPLPESSIPLSEIIEQGFDNIYDGVRTDARGHRIIDVNNPHPDLKPIVTIPRPVGSISIVKDQGHNDHLPAPKPLATISN